LPNAIDVLHDVIVPEAHDLDPARSEERRAARIISDVLSVLATIKLDSEFELGAIKVRVVRADRMLAAERYAKLRAAQKQLEPPFCVRHLSAQIARSFSFFFRARETLQATPSLPPPCRGRNLHRHRNSSL